MSLHRKRPLIGFFDYPDVFEDFWPHYGVDQHAFFTTRRATTGHYATLSLLQREIGDVIWYVLSLAPELSEVRHETLGCQVKFLPSSWLHRRLWSLFWLRLAGWHWQRIAPVFATVASYMALISLPFIKVLWRDRPDFLFVQDYSSGRFDMLLLAARALGVPLIAYHSGSRPDFYLGRYAKRWTIPRADMLIVSSHDELEMLVGRYHVPRERLRVILAPINITEFQPMDRTEACRRTGIDPARRYLLFVGRLDDGVKRVSALIQAFSAIASTHHDMDLIIVGDGPDCMRLQTLAAEQAPKRVHFFGWVSEAKRLVSIYNSAESLVLPSWREGFPFVLGEAMACGTPVLASQVGGVSELIVEDKTGWLIPPGDDEALKERLSFISTHREIMASMRPQARKMAEARVSAEAVTDALRNCFLNAKQEHVA
jgi:glycosyltransferase involved in cell wall biosynthesis